MCGRITLRPTTTIRMLPCVNSYHFGRNLRVMFVRKAMWGRIRGMKARYSRRKVSAALLGAVAGSLAGSRVVFAQTPETSSPVAVSGDALFAGVTLEEGVAPTIHGDVALPATVERVVTITDGAVDAMTAVGVTPVGVTASSNFESVA